MKQKLLILIAVLLTTFHVSAASYDFEVDGMYYKVVSLQENTCKVTKGGTTYSGDIVIPDAVTYNGRTFSVIDFGTTFKSNTQITSVVIGNSVTSIVSGAFSGCKGLKTLKIPNSVTALNSNQMCYDCSALETVELPSSMTQLGNYAFYGCSSLTSIELPASITQLGERSLRGCSSLTQIKIPDAVTVIESDAFCDCSNLASVKMPSSIKQIGGGAFGNCESLEAIELPATLTEIGTGAFSGCTKLATATVPDQVKVLREVFKNCSSLASVVLGKSVKELYDTFYGCTNLMEITSLNATPPTVNTAATFRGVDKMSCIVKVRSAFVSNYQSAYEWNTFWNIEAIDKSALHFTAGGINYVATSANTVTVEQGEYSGDITIPSTVSYGGTSYTVTAIGDKAFYNCKELTSIEMPNTITEICHGAFGLCSGLTSVVIPNSVTVIGDIAFIYCSKMTTAVIGSSVMSLGMGAFAYCSSLAEVTSLNLTPPTLADAAFQEAGVWHWGLKVPEEAVEAYKATEWDVYFHSITGIAGLGVSGVAGRASVTSPVYNLGGLPVGDGFRGIVIRDGKKYLKK